MMTFAPFFGSDAVPARVKAGFTLVLTAMLYSICPVPEIQPGALSWIRVALSEAAVGLMMGLSVQLVFEGMQIAGQLAGVQLGFSLAAIIDPQTNIETPVLSVFHQMFALLIFLAAERPPLDAAGRGEEFRLSAGGHGPGQARGGARTVPGGRRDVADRRADCRSRLPGNDAGGRDSGFSEQGVAAATGNVYRHLGKKLDWLRGAGCFCCSLARTARGEVCKRTRMERTLAPSGALGETIVPQENKSEKPTGRRKQKAREKGQISRSRDLVTALTLLTVTMMLAWQPHIWIGRWRDLFGRLLVTSTRAEIGLGTPIFSWTALAVAQWVAPIVFLALGVAVFSNAAQGGFVFAPEALKPNWERLNPASHITQMFSFAALSRVLRSLVPVAAISFLSVTHDRARISVARAHVALRLARIACEAWLAAFRTGVEVRTGAARLVRPRTTCSSAGTTSVR